MKSDESYMAPHLHPTTTSGATKKVQPQQQMTGSQNLGSGFKKSIWSLMIFRFQTSFLVCFRGWHIPKALNVRYIYLHLFILYPKYLQPLHWRVQGSLGYGKCW